MATRWTSKHTGQKIDDTIDCVSNPNLLDNWYFGNPVNQRGQTSYTGSGYMIDRWYADEVVLAISSGAIRVSRSSVGQWYARIMQNLETKLSKEIAGKTCTLSALVKSVSGIGQAQLSLFNISDNANDANIYVDLTGGIDLITVTFVVPESYSGKSLGVFFYPDVKDSHRSNGCDVYAIKLELGSHQTLAHQDADGNWVLNEIPDYGEQLRRCQYYSRFFGYDIEIPCSNNPDGKHIEGTLPLTMRSGNGSISYSEGFLFFGDRSFYAVSGANVHSNGGRVKIGANVSGQLQSNIQATLYLRNCSILFDL